MAPLLHRAAIKTTSQPVAVDGVT